MMTLTETTPGLAVRSVNLENRVEIFSGLWKLFAGPEDQAYGIHGPDGLRVVAQGMLIRTHSLLEITDYFGKTP